MTGKQKRKIVSAKRENNEREKDDNPQGLYFGDYRPRYQEQYNIYEKAKLHIKVQKGKMEKEM